MPYFFLIVPSEASWGLVAPISSLFPNTAFSFSIIITTIVDEKISNSFVNVSENKYSLFLLIKITAKKGANKIICSHIKHTKGKKIKTNAENLETLSNAYLSSKEHIKAANKLQEASKLSDDPELIYRLGQIELNLSRWDKAIESFQLAQDKGWNKEKGKIEYFIGISFIELEEFNQAVKYLSMSSELGQDKLVEPWLQYIEYLQKTAS